MKNKIKLLFFLMFAGILSTHAQQGMQRRTVEERVKMTMDRITDSLKFDADQQKSTTAAFTDYYKATDKLREGLEPGTRPDRAQMEKLMNERDEALKKIWKEDQFKHYKEMEAAMRQR